MKQVMTIAEIKQSLIAPNQPSDAQFALWHDDSRKGVQKLLKQYANQQAKQAQLRRQFLTRTEFERNLHPKYKLIAGVDEVGRGPLAGPVVTAAVVLPADFAEMHVNDSKQLTFHERQLLYKIIMSHAVEASIGVADAAMIDRENIYHATQLAMKQAVTDLAVQPDYLLVDAMHIDTHIPQLKLIKGDARSISIGAASIVAKVVRDHLMRTYDLVYPGYGFAQNAGYGTAVHLDGLAKLGVTPIHRRSFSPVHKLLR